MVFNLIQADETKIKPMKTVRPVDNVLFIEIMLKNNLEIIVVYMLQ